MYLLDTNIVSELARRQPDAKVADFMERAKCAAEPMYLSVLTIGEINKGIRKLHRYGDTRQAAKLQLWLSELKGEYSDYLLPIDSDVSELWGMLLASTDDTNAIDKLIAATAMLYGLSLVTRNVDHVAGTGVVCINPFML
jgi:hypothetical protein